MRTESSASFSIKASDGVELAADVWNQDAKATLFLLPAGAETRAVWRPVIDRLGAEVISNWRIVTADHRGHGGSGRSEAYEFEEFYRDERIFEVSQILGIELVELHRELSKAEAAP